MRLITAAILSLVLPALFLFPAPRAVGSAGHYRPPGIAASAWVPISRDFGAVIEQPIPGHARERQLPSALGYFAVWRNGHWLRLDSVLQQPPLQRPLRPASARLSIGRNLVFVIEHERSGSALGYFAVKRGAHWLRLDPNAQDALFRGPLTARPAPDRIRIGSSLRFVIEQQMPERYVPRRVPGQLPSVLGYFMGKRGGDWVRLRSIA